MGIERFESMDVNILLSIVNMKLRDDFSDLDSLVRFYDINKEQLIKRLFDAGFEYMDDLNQFR
ncbi:hypothetical protein VHA01S_090_00050 [Vibrio halioticoli NBRC 102217]|uniref:DUF4250 domain-containing protein n=1 Tax=Vibrio halioticoli NBRC 102217 TaxID=1219072 RepID=V5HQ67_9VIBR|nr:DUF4250 domain-containing protein [Vibrio halioticoli]GAD91390.1 hypothetical protein VHA01S_090_00050 [Vibrio halioticoli NBRC 102217]